MAQTCKNVRFISNYKVDETWIENKTMVFVVFESPEVEYYNSYVSYNWMSLLAEIGGMLGLTLGASVFTSFEFLFHQIPYYTTSWELWKHPNAVPGGRPIFFKPEWPKESKNGFKTISYRPYPLVFFSNYFFRYQKSSKKSHGITSDSFPNNFYAL